MNNVDLAKLKKCELEILFEIDRICKKHNIEYFLAYGSVLGSIRHRGFIPWDDDIDIFMRIDELHRFKEVCKTELSEPYFYQDWHTDPYVSNAWAKIRNSNTASIQKGREDYPINWGICIDIFPLVRCKTQRMNYWQKLNLVLMCYFGTKRLSDYGYVNYKAAKIQPKVFPLWFCDIIRNIAEKNMQRNTKKGDYLLVMNEGTARKRGAYCAKWFDSVIEGEFEGHKFPLMADPDGYLKFEYGDYMTLPAEEDRVAHGEIIVDDQNSYTKYIKKR